MMTNEPDLVINSDMVMKRRMIIYEKIKTTKLNKLTIKQGDVNVKFNLKKDLLDSNVDIPEKVLCMLENYEVNTNKPGDVNEENESSSPTSAQVSIPIQSPISNETQSHLNNTTSPSTKRVRFDLNESHAASSFLQSEDLAIESSTPSRTKSSIIITKITSKEQSQADKGPISDETDKDTNDANQRQFICRLCRLKCSNERALYEHVARLHGGKGPSNNQSSQDQDFDEENDDFLEEDDDFDDQDSYLSSNSDIAASSSSGGPFKKRKANSINRKSLLKHSSIAKPNLAIRVAKAAYYNNKDSLNPLKSNIFTNGGIRGNFFSQERLPLKSCKIKMKLAHGLLSNGEMLIDSPSNHPDKFLTNTTDITKFNFISKNSTITTQSIKSNEKELLLTDVEIKNFFKSLLSYIPNTVTRLEDLIKQKESYLKELDTNSLKCIRLAHELILDAKQFGINLNTLKASIQLKMNQKISLKLVLNVLDILIENCLILSVGVVERVYVANEFKQHWVIQSFKNQKGVATTSSSNEPDSDLEINADTDLIEDTSLRIETKSSSGRRIITRKKSYNFDDDQNESELLTKKFKTVCLIPRPWRYIDGLLNRPVLKQMLETIILHLKAYPNSTLESLYSHFSPILQPIMTLELIEMLEKLKCVQKFVLKKEISCNLFSDFNNGSVKIDSDSENETNLDGDETFTYYCSQNSIFTIKKVFPD